MKNQGQPKINELTKLFTKDLFSGLSARESEIITGRYGIGISHQTLSAIGRKFGLSRERVRQIEVEIKKKLKKRISEKHLEEYNNLSLIILNQGNILSEHHLKELLKEVEADHQNIVRLLLDLNDRLTRIKNHQHLKNGWVDKELDLEGSLKILGEATQYLKKLELPVRLNQLKSNLSRSENLSEIELVGLLKSAQSIIVTKKGEFGLVTNRKINPKTIGDKIEYVLSESKKPMHFAEIAESIRNSKFDHKNINKSTVHNELIANSDYVLVGRGLYALKKWGYSEGTIGDVILNFLKNQEKPQKLSQILEFVSKQRIVKKNTVLVNLTKSSKIAKNASGEYYLK